MKIFSKHINLTEAVDLWAKESGKQIDKSKLKGWKYAYRKDNPYVHGEGVRASISVEHLPSLRKFMEDKLTGVNSTPGQDTSKHLQIGDTFPTNRSGTLTVVSKKLGNFYHVYFNQTGFTFRATKEAILRGNVRDPYFPSVVGVGYMGEGPHISSHPLYKIWAAMLLRCYKEDTNSWKFYGAKGVYVADEWHCFQNFVDWCVLNNPSGEANLEMDKDIKCKDLEGPSYYGPETITFITREENLKVAHAKTVTLVSPEGELVKINNIREFCRKVNLNQSSISKLVRGNQSHHKGWSLPK